MLDFRRKPASLFAAALFAAAAAGCGSHAALPSSSLQMPSAMLRHRKNVPSQTLLEMDKNFYKCLCVDVMTPPYTGKVQHVKSGMSDPQAIGIDGKNDLFVLNGSDTIVEYAPPYKGLPRRTINTPLDNGGLGLGVDKSGDLFLAPGFGPILVVFKPPYTGQPLENSQCPPSSGCAGGNMLALSANGTAFVTAVAAGNAVLAYAPPYTGAPTAIDGNFGLVAAMATDSHNDLFVADTYDNDVEMYRPPYTQAPVKITKTIQAPFSLAVDANDNLYVANGTGTSNWIARFAPPYKRKPSIINHVDDVHTLATDSSGRLFVGDLRGVDVYANRRRVMTLNKPGAAEQLLFTY